MATLVVMDDAPSMGSQRKAPDCIGYIGVLCSVPRLSHSLCVDQDMRSHRKALDQLHAMYIMKRFGTSS